jgi:hypothetical protein
MEELLIRRNRWTKGVVIAGSTRKSWIPDQVRDDSPGINPGMTARRTSPR